MNRAFDWICKGNQPGKRWNNMIQERNAYSAKNPSNGKSFPLKPVFVHDLVPNSISRPANANVNMDRGRPERTRKRKPCLRPQKPDQKGKKGRSVDCTWVPILIFVHPNGFKTKIYWIDPGSHLDFHVTKWSQKHKYLDYTWVLMCDFVCLHGFRH